MSLQSWLSLDRSCSKIPSLPSPRPRQDPVKRQRLLKYGLENQNQFRDYNIATATICSAFLFLHLFWKDDQVKAETELLLSTTPRTAVRLKSWRGWWSWLLWAITLPQKCAAVRSSSASWIEPLDAGHIRLLDWLLIKELWLGQWRNYNWESCRRPLWFICCCFIYLFLYYTCPRLDALNSPPGSAASSSYYCQGYKVFIVTWSHFVSAVCCTDSNIQSKNSKQKCIYLYPYLWPKAKHPSQVDVT